MANDDDGLEAMSFGELQRCRELSIKGCRHKSKAGLMELIRRGLCTSPAGELGAQAVRRRCAGPTLLQDRPLTMLSSTTAGAVGTRPGLATAAGALPGAAPQGELEGSVVRWLSTPPQGTAVGVAPDASWPLLSWDSQGSARGRHVHTSRALVHERPLKTL